MKEKLEEIVKKLNWRGLNNEHYILASGYECDKDEFRGFIELFRGDDKGNRLSLIKWFYYSDLNLENNLDKLLENIAVHSVDKMANDKTKNSK